MKDIIQYLQKIPNKNPFIDVLACVDINNGVITINNGRICVKTYLKEFIGIKALVPSDKFFSAVIGCKYEPQIRATEKSLILSNGNFKTRIAISQDKIMPEIELVNPETVNCTDEIVDVIKKLKPFISDSDARPWAASIRFDNNYAYATNNVIFVRTRLVTPLTIDIPDFVINEIIKFKKPPLSIEKSKKSIGLYWDDMVITSCLYTDGWPNNIAVMFIPLDKKRATKINKNLRSELDKIIPFCSNKNIPLIELSNKGLSTGEGETAASYAGHEFSYSTWHAEVLKLVFDTAEYFDTTNYPKLCSFEGNDIEGLAVGTRRQ